MLPKLAMALLLVLTAALASCVKIDKGIVAGGAIGTALAPYKDAIPKDYGRFVGVSGIDDQGLTALWFEKPDGTITAVNVQVTQRKMFTEVAVMERR